MMENNTADSTSGNFPNITMHPKNWEGYEHIGPFPFDELPLELQVHLLKSVLVELLEEKERYQENEITTDGEDEDDDSYRIDSQTQERIQSGWVFDAGAHYIGEEKRAERLCQELWGMTIEQAYEQDLVYWAEWD